MENLNAQGALKEESDKNSAILNLMTFNIRTIAKSDTELRAWDNRKTAVVEYINGLNADVICMQEVKIPQYEYIRDNISVKYEVMHYPIASGADSGGEAVAYNKEIFEKVEDKRFWLSETPEVESIGWDADYKRVCANVLLKHKETGIMLNVFNVHLDHIGAVARKKGIELIMERARETNYPTFLTGDFNTKETCECYKAAADYLQDCQKTAPDTDEGISFNKWGVIGDYSTTPIDFCFVSKENMKPLVFKICRDKWDGKNYYSDHYALKTIVEVTSDSNR